MVRVFLAIIAVNVALFGVAAFTYWQWPDEPESAYLCKTLDNGVDAPYTPVKVCISKTDITDGRFEACKRPVGFSGILDSVLIVYDAEGDTYCAVELPERQDAAP